MGVAYGLEGSLQQKANSGTLNKEKIKL